MATKVPSLFKIGQAIKGRFGTYIITKEYQAGVWAAKNSLKETVVVKSVADHPRVENERDNLRRFQEQTPCIRPILDEVVNTSIPTTIILKHLDTTLLDASIKRNLNRKELKYVSRRVLEAIQVLHADGYVHTADIKPDNVFINYGQGDLRFANVQLGDLGGSYPMDSKWAKEGTPVGAPMWSSPEIIMERPWNTATDIWSFGAMLISLIYGGNFCLFRPRTVSYDHEEYGLEVLKRQFQYFGPFEKEYLEIASPEVVQAIFWLMQEVPAATMTQFHRTTEREVCQSDKDFIGKIMKLDWRQRPTAKELLEDEWWMEPEESRP
ncbi:serine/threonine protein kinase [Microthyrium microscopicum]|uniref:Serine/threonine protein kinase n=1 Tax=Microthyrium microscopicum TaxID=703497 RepID=A0A6A6TW09_9PEZI|nr:serine/threonine protein kinase [Microthyrium microscopicum]